MAIAPTPPRTPTARKTLPGSPCAVLPNVTATGSPISLQKRKWQGGPLASPLTGLIQPGYGSGSAPVAPMAVSKRQKVGEETKIEQPQQQHQYPDHYLSMPASPRNPNFVQHCSNSPFRPQQPHQPLQPSVQPSEPYASHTLPQQIFLTALQMRNSLRPREPKKNPINSRHIDAIAHAMWDVVFSQTDIMNNVTMKAALFAPLKLRALAKLNWLPSWWLLREMALSVMEHSQWIVDDSEREGEWTLAVQWCKKAELKVHGDSSAMQNPGGSAPNPEEIPKSG